ncbi:MAG TPA: protein phosphatase 2C domain-containing protein [Methanolinea sp.]|nr:protein phosphatase 2C domain-containing protein [Methanolinea sp.]
MHGGVKGERDTPPGEIRTCSYTDRGVRDLNEDSCGAFTLTHPGGRLFLLAVADGLGGHPAGEVASDLAISALRTAVSSAVQTFSVIDAGSLRMVLASGFSHANREVIRHASICPGCEGMGTTMVAAIMNEQGAGVVGNVGDSRAYLVGDGIRRITSDHSRVQEMVDQGLISSEEAQNHPMRHIVTRIVGRPGDTPDFSPFHLGSDLLVLCSDGLLDGVSEQEMHSIALHHPLPGICRLLVENAKERSRDNITVVAAARR